MSDLIQEPTCLSLSKIWELQAEYYRSSGAGAWNNATPFFVTNSAFMAESYARLVVAFLRDYSAHFDRKQPVTLLELGAGLGRFGFHLLRTILRLQGYFPETAELNLRLVLTDISENCVSFWRQHPKFANFIESGQLDFAIYNPAVDSQIELVLSQQMLTSANPVVVLANYYFDSIPFDAFTVKQGRLEEWHLSLRRSPQAPDGPLSVADTLRDFTAVVVDPESRYEDGFEKALLRDYSEQVEGNISVPVAGFATLRSLQNMFPAGLMVVATDKGLVNEFDMAQLQSHQLVVHGSSFSTAVNFDAFRRYFEQLGGESLVTSRRSIQCHTFVGLLLAHQVPLSNLTYSFKEQLDRENLINSVNDLHPLFSEPELPLPEVDCLLSFMRLNQCDPKSLTMCAEMLHRRLDEMRPRQRAELLDIMDRAADNYFHFPGEVNVPFWLGFLYCLLGENEKALPHLDAAIDNFHEHPIIHGLRGDALTALGRYQPAFDAYSRALELDPTIEEFERARSALPLSTH